MARKKYDEAFRAAAVKLVRDGRRDGKSLERVAKNLNVHANTLREWVRRDDFVHAGDGTNTANLEPASEVEQLRKEIRVLKMEREILKKSHGPLRQGQLVIFEFVDAQRAHYSVEMLCDVLDVSRAGFYAWKKRGVSQRRIDDARLAIEIAKIHEESDKAYGSPRVHVALEKQGRRVSRKRVARVMRQGNLAGKRRRGFRVTTTTRDETLPIAPNLLARCFAQSKPNRVWVGDITYLWTREGWMYLAVLIDLYSRRVVGWAMSISLSTELPLTALRMAIRTRRPPPGLIHHTDQGCQYASHAYRRELKAHGMICSMSRRGNCWDNAVAESFFATLKVELDIHFDTRDQARSRCFEYIEGFYNRRRLHSSIGYEIPEQFESKLRKAA